MSTPITICSDCSVASAAVFYSASNSFSSLWWHCWWMSRFWLILIASTGIISSLSSGIRCIGISSTNRSISHSWTLHPKAFHTIALILLVLCYRYSDVALLAACYLNVFLGSLGLSWLSDLGLVTWAFRINTNLIISFMHCIIIANSALEECSLFVVIIINFLPLLLLRLLRPTVLGSLFYPVLIFCLWKPTWRLTWCNIYSLLLFSVVLVVFIFKI